MSATQPFIDKKSKAQIIFFLSATVATFWFLSQLINVYKFVLVGVIFEILWLPMLVLLFALPLFSLYQFVKENFNFKSHYFYSFLLLAATIIVLFTFFK